VGLVGVCTPERRGSEEHSGDLISLQSPWPNWERFGASQILLEYWSGGSKAPQTLWVCSCTNCGPQSFGRYWVHVSHPSRTPLPFSGPPSKFKVRVEEEPQSIMPWELIRPSKHHYKMRLNTITKWLTMCGSLWPKLNKVRVFKFSVGCVVNMVLSSCRAKSMTPVMSVSEPISSLTDGSWLRMNCIIKTNSYLIMSWLYMCKVF
jgi:hypothetical protein